jgi:hypothetical protein
MQIEHPMCYTFFDDRFVKGVRQVREGMLWGYENSFLEAITTMNGNLLRFPTEKRRASGRSPSLIMMSQARKGLRIMTSIPSLETGEMRR